VEKRCTVESNLAENWDKKNLVKLWDEKMKNVSIVG